MKMGTPLVAAAVLGLLGSAAAAQESAPAAAEAVQVWTPSWTTPEIELIASMMTGTWASSSEVAQTDGAGTIKIMMTMVPAPVDGIPNTLYVEAAREDAFFEPYRQAVFALYAYKGGVRLRTYEFRNSPGLKGALVGLVFAPDLIRPIPASDLIATLDIDLAKSGNGYAGKTPYPYPTGVSGAVEMTSEISIDAATLVSVDRGIAADGSVAWGSAPGDRYEFTKVQAPVSVTRSPEGVVSIVLKSGEGEEIQSGQLATVQYTGFLDDGRIFDSSRQRPQPLTFRWPGQMVPGWNIGMSGLKNGERRRIVIPSDQGYGPQGRAGVIPPNARLTFDVECLSIRGVEGQNVAPETPGAASGGH